MTSQPRPNQIKGMSITQRIMAQATGELERSDDALVGQELVDYKVERVRAAERRAAQERKDEIARIARASKRDRFITRRHTITVKPKRFK